MDFQQLSCHNLTPNFYFKTISMTENIFAKGSCSCGAVNLSIHGEPKMMAQCHCSDCQKATGTGHISLSFFAEDDVNVQGETSSYVSTTDSGNQSTRHFCPTCGSRLFGKNSGRPGMTSVAVGCLDDNSWFKPGAVVYTKNRQDWDITSTDIPNFEEMPPPPPAS